MQSVLMVDVGGSHVKLMVGGSQEMRRCASGNRLTARQMARQVRDLAHGWDYEAVTIGYPGQVVHGRPAREPPNLGGGWVEFDYERALGRPVRLINDAAMQALAGYEGGRMLFVGLGTSVGAALIVDDVLVPLELAVLKLSTHADLATRLSKQALREHGLTRWRTALRRALATLQGAFTPDEILLGGGNAECLEPLPPRVRRWANELAFRGAQRLWGDEQGLVAVPQATSWRLMRGQR